MLITLEKLNHKVVPGPFSSDIQLWLFYVDILNNSCINSWQDWQKLVRGAMSHNCQWVMFIVENFKVNLWVWQEFLFRTYPEEKMKERFKNKFDSNAYWYRFRSMDRPFWADGRSKGEIIIYISADMAHTIWAILCSRWLFLKHQSFMNIRNWSNHQNFQKCVVEKFC